MPPLASDLVEATRRYLYAGYQDELNELAGTLDATATQFTLTQDPMGITRGATIAVDLEEMFVWGITTRTVTVRRGMNGSTAATHAAGAVVHVRPKFSPFRIFTELNNDLRDLSAPQNGLFRMLTADITFNPARWGYDLPGDVQQVYEIRYQELSPGRSYPRIDNYDLARNMPTGDFASGTALLLHEGGAPSRSIRIRYKAAFGTLTALTDDVPTVTGLPSTAVDIPPLGAAIRLVAPREIKRNFTEPQPEPRRAEEVPPGAVLGSMRGLAALRQQRIVAEHQRLLRQYPPVMPL